MILRGARADACWCEVDACWCEGAMLAGARGDTRGGEGGRGRGARERPGRGRGAIGGGGAGASWGGGGRWRVRGATLVGARSTLAGARADTYWCEARMRAGATLDICGCEARS